MSNDNDGSLREMECTYLDKTGIKHCNALKYLKTISFIFEEILSIFGKNWHTNILFNPD